MDIRNNAAWIDGAGEKVRVGPRELREPAPGEVIIENHAVAINPIDCLMQRTGNWVESWPTIFGHDLSGKIVSVGSGVADLVPGQRVLALAVNMSLDSTSFQNYSIVPANVTTPIPDTMTYEEASVIPLAVATAAAGLYQEGYLALPLPQTNDDVPKKLGKAILIWGGSSSVGSAAIQLAVASGFDVITTASEKNFEFCHSLGAEQVFDYHSSTVVEDLIAALSQRSLAGAYAAVSTEETVSTVAKVISKLGGSFIATSKPPPSSLPENVTAKMLFATEYAMVEGKKIFRDYLEAAIKSGNFKAVPKAHVVGTGLGAVQTGLEELNKGVSSTKVVVKLCEE